MLKNAKFFKITGLHLRAIRTYDKLLQKISRGDLRAPHQLLAEILCQRGGCFLFLVSKTFCDVVVFDILKRSRKMRRVHIFGNCFLYNYVDHCLLDSWGNLTLFCTLFHDCLHCRGILTVLYLTLTEVST